MGIQGLAGVSAALLLLLAGASPARAQASPPLTQQPAWTEQDKAEFLRYLNSTAMPTGSVSKTAASPATEAEWSDRAARSVELGPTSLLLFPYSGNHYSGAADGGGGRLLLEQHFRPWLRAYAGLEVDQLKQKELGGQTADLTRWAAPVGLEFALVPLATPQTRYVLMRLGVAPSEVVGPGGRSSYAAPVLGGSAAWDLGLGYEWQISDSRWRVNAALDGLRSIANRGGVSYYGLGAHVAAVYTF